MGGWWRKQVRTIVAEYPVLAHGLSLSIGGTHPLDVTFLNEVKSFLQQNRVLLFSEHLSFSQVENAHLHELFPMPFTEEAIQHVVPRIQKVQDHLERPLVLENISYYTNSMQEMNEAQFIRHILEEADCYLLLDINNVYVNAFNHQYDPREFIMSLPLERVAYIHMAGHEQVAPDLIIDTHGQPIADPVWELFGWALDYVSPVPVLLERDFNIPAWKDIYPEWQHLQHITQQKWQSYGQPA